MIRKRKLWALSLLILSLCVAFVVTTGSPGAAGRVFSIDESAQAAEAPRRRKAQEVQFIRPRVGTIRRAVRMAAEIKPDREALIYGQVSGYVQPHPVEVGTRVDPAGGEGGAVLLRIAVPQLDARVVIASSQIARATAGAAEAKAAVLGAKQGMAEAEAMARQAKGMIRAAQANVREEQAELSLHQKIFTRLQAVLAKSPNLVAQDRVDQAMGAVEISKAQLEEAQFGVKKAEDDAVVATARVAAAGARTVAAEAGVTAALAERKLAESMLVEAKALQSFATIQAPFKGVVADRMVDTGDLVMDATRNSGAKPLFRVVADDKMRIRFFISEPDSPFCVVGNKVEVGIDVLEGKPFDATIVRIADALDPKTRTMEVEAELENPRDEAGRKKLRADMFARVKVFLEEHHDTLIVPARCVKTKKRKSTVLVIQVDDSVEPVEIQIGVDDGIEIQIIGGSVTKDSRIVSRGGTKVSKGDKVIPVAADRK